MGFFDLEEKEAKLRDPALRGLSVELLHRKGCEVCPLNRNKQANAPHMEPTGSKKPLIYMLTGQVTEYEDEQDNHGVGAYAKLVRRYLPSDWHANLRWNSVTRTLTPDLRPPSHVEIECCRPSVIADIERTKPAAIFGFGALPLAWALNETHPTRWSGRYAPVRIGKHTCWYFPFQDPVEIIDHRQFAKGSRRTDEEFTFELHLKRALKWVNRLADVTPVVHDRARATRDIHWVTGRERGDMQKVMEWIDALYDEEVIGLDYETSVLRPYTLGNKTGKILTTGVATKDEAFAWANRHRSAGWTTGQLEDIEKHWQRFLLRAKTRKVSHHLIFEAEWSAVKFGLDTILTETWEDSETQAYVLDERPGGLSLDFLCVMHYGLPVKDLFRMNRQDMESETLETILEYNGLDARYHRGLFFKQKPMVRDEGMNAVYRHGVRRAIASAATTFMGVPIDQKQVTTFYKEHKKQLTDAGEAIERLEIADQFHRLYGHSLRPSNSKDVEKALTKIAGIKLEPTKQKNKFKAPPTDAEGNLNLSTSEKALTKVKHPLVKAIIKWRKIDKLISTYILPVRPDSPHMFCDDAKGVSPLRLHPIVSTTKARTWRTTSEDPNIQNWPHRGPSVYIRRQVAVDDDHVIVSIDYAGIQARNVAMESLDKTLLQYYWDRYDIHSDWLARLLKLKPSWRPVEPIGDVTGDKLHKELRGSVKNKFVFPSFFGAIGRTISGYLGIDEKMGQKLSDEFFEHFSGVHAYHESQREFYNEHGYVTGRSEFKRRAPIEINQLINAPIQSDESIIVCGAWERLVHTGDRRCIPNWMIHDDLSFIWRKKELDRMLEKVVPIILKQVHKWERVVPMEIEIKIGQNWCDMKEIAKFETTKGGGYHEVGGTTYSDRWDYKIGDDGVPLSRQTGWTK